MPVSSSLSVTPPEWLTAIMRVDLMHGPTALEPLDRLSEQLGGPRLWIKRDDCTGLATGGNKTRKLEYLIAAALRENADTVITFGAMQSNHARQTAAACAKFGLECHLILSRSVDWPHPEYETGGNVHLENLLGARVHRTEPDQSKQTYGGLRESLAAKGKSVYVIPAGGSNPVGALGYVRCGWEILSQANESGFDPGLIVHATASGGTQAGLMVAIAEAATECEVLGVNVSTSDFPGLSARIGSLAQDVVALGPRRGELITPLINNDYVGPGYGQPTPKMAAAVRMLAQHEGIILDPVYSGKAFGGLVGLMEDGQLDAHEDVVFVHTGGVAVHAVYKSAF